MKLRDENPHDPLPLPKYMLYLDRSLRRKGRKTHRRILPAVRSDVGARFTTERSFPIHQPEKSVPGGGHPFKPMFKNFHFSWALTVLAAAGAMLWTACNDDSTETPPDGPQTKTPHVELAKGSATSTTLTFTATSSDAEKCAYLVLPATDEEPAAEAILQGGGNSHRIKA